MEQLVTETTSINEEAAQLMKFHGSYQQDDREKRTGGKGKHYQFMMRTKQACGTVSNQLYLTMDDLADQVRPRLAIYQRPHCYGSSAHTIYSDALLLHQAYKLVFECNVAVHQSYHFGCGWADATFFMNCGHNSWACHSSSERSLLLQYGEGTLRLTTRQAFQLHGVLKQDLKTVFSSVIKALGSTLGACGDVNRNIMAPPAPYKDRPEYKHATKVAHDFADLLAPQSGAYYDIWLDGEKFVSMTMEVCLPTCLMLIKAACICIPPMAQPLCRMQCISRYSTCC